MLESSPAPDVPAAGAAPNPAAPAAPPRPAHVPHLTVLVSVFNEVENLPELLARLRAALDPWLGRDYELLFVNDGSTDGSAELLDAEAAQDPRVAVIHFVRNFGQHAAITAGMAYARGEILVLMDADLQDPPDQIRRLYEEHRKGIPMVFAVRRERADSLLRRLGGKAFFAIVRFSLQQRIPTNIGTFRLLSRPVVDAFNRLGERSRITGPLNHWMGFKCSYLEVEHQPRYKGQSKYGLWGLVRLSLWILTAFSYLPIRVATALGLGLLLLGGGFTLYTVLRHLVVGDVLFGYTSLVALITMFAGVQIVLIGLIGEYVGRILTEVQHRPLYLIDRRVNLPGTPDHLEPGPGYEVQVHRSGAARA